MRFYPLIIESLCNLIKVSSIQIYVIILVLDVMKLEKRIDITHTFCLFVVVLPYITPLITKFNIVYQNIRSLRDNFELTYQLKSSSPKIKIMIKLERKIVTSEIFRQFWSIYCHIWSIFTTFTPWKLQNISKMDEKCILDT